MKTPFSDRLALFVLGAYQIFLAPFLGGRCRFYPSCSEYARGCVEWHGVGRGGRLALARICRCHPLGGHGVDLVPDKRHG